MNTVIIVMTVADYLKNLRARSKTVVREISMYVRFAVKDPQLLYLPEAVLNSVTALHIPFYSLFRFEG